MSILTAVSMLLFIGCCSAVGLRILWLAQRTRGLVELACGLGFTLIGLFGYPLGIASGNGVETVGEMSVPLYLVASLFTWGGISAFYLFTWRAFRPDERWAAGLVFVAIAGQAVGVMLATGALLAAVPEAHSFVVTFRATLVVQFFSTACFVWAGVEALLCWRVSRHRLAIGLGDPLASLRFLSWAIFGGSTTLLCLVFAAVQWSGQAPAASPVVHLSSAVLGLVSGGAIALGFLAPAHHVTRVERRAGVFSS